MRTASGEINEIPDSACAIYGGTSDRIAASPRNQIMGQQSTLAEISFPYFERSKSWPSIFSLRNQF
jgi:hypothetical protein